MRNSHNPGSRVSTYAFSTSVSLNASAQAIRPNTRRKRGEEACIVRNVIGFLRIARPAPCQGVGEIAELLQRRVVRDRA